MPFFSCHPLTRPTLAVALDDDPRPSWRPYHFTTKLSSKIWSMMRTSNCSTIHAHVATALKSRLHSSEQRKMSRGVPAARS